MSDTAGTQASSGAPKRRTGLLVFAWAWVSLPFAYGTAELGRTLVQLFGG
ncbi:hypothetical protein [Saccharomonospora sp. CUA-673]|nr:hypothetical protein [Saccharomonospora sp. CUA-673]